MLTESVLTQRDSIRKLILQVEVLAKSLQELQNHQCLSKEIGRKPGPHGEWAGELLETHRRNIESCGPETRAAVGKGRSHLQIFTLHIFPGFVPQFQPLGILLLLLL